MSEFVLELKNGMSSDPGEDVFGGIWKEYERVILNSLVTSFGLDMLIRDQHGGDVDTIHNVRQIGSDPDMYYKNAHNEAAYNSIEKYDGNAYHRDSRFSSMKSQARKDFQEHQIKQEDAYVPGNMVFYAGKSKSVSEGHKAELDHVIAAKRIHEDRGRILSGLDGIDLANDPGNLRFTNAALNGNMSKMTMDEYIKWCDEHPDQVNWNGHPGTPLPEEVKQRLRAEEKRAKKEYNAKLNKAYYTSTQFLKDTGAAAVRTAATMGLREAFGFIFVEIWLGAKEELQAIPANRSLSDILSAVGTGIKKGAENAKSKYKQILARLKDGALAGALSSITTTICNIFFTTAKNLGRCIRQIYASVVQAGRVLLFNPDNLMFGDRIKTATVILATGASVLVGTAVGEAIGAYVGAIPVVGTIIKTFVSTLVSGLMSCSLLLFLDRSKFMNNLIEKLNAIPTEVNNYREIADAMESLAAKLANLDIQKFRQDTMRFKDIATDLDNACCASEINSVLLTAYKKLDIKIPWQGDFDTFMSDKSNRLVFG